MLKKNFWKNKWLKTVFIWKGFIIGAGLITITSLSNQFQNNQTQLKDNFFKTNHQLQPTFLNSSKLQTQVNFNDQNHSVKRLIFSNFQTKTPQHQIKSTLLQTKSALTFNWSDLSFLNADDKAPNPGESTKSSGDLSGVLGGVISGSIVILVGGFIWYVNHKRNKEQDKKSKDQKTKGLESNDPQIK